jgi:hypothetical protein
VSKYLLETKRCIVRYLSLVLHMTSCQCSSPLSSVYSILSLSFHSSSVSNFYLWPNSPTRALAASLFRFLGHTHPVGLLRTSDQLDAEAATYKTHNKSRRWTSKPSAGFKLAISAVERLQTYALDRTATGIGLSSNYRSKISPVVLPCYWSGKTCWQNKRLLTKIRLLNEMIAFSQ